MIPSQVYSVFGDCQAARFDGTVIERPGHPGEVVVGRARWQPLLRADDVFIDGCFSEFITRALVENRVLRASPAETGFPFLPLSMPVERGAYTTHHYLPRPRALEMPLVFSIGEVDSFDLGHEINGNVRIDIPLGDDLRGLPYPDPSLPAASPEAIRARIRERCATFFAGLRALQDAGFTNVFLHGLLPPSPDCGVGWPPVIVRLKLNALFNEVYRQFCDEAGIGFVPLWDEVMRDGLRDTRYDADGLHCNPASAAISLRVLHEAIEARTAAA